MSQSLTIFLTYLVQDVRDGFEGAHIIICGRVIRTLVYEPDEFPQCLSEQLCYGIIGHQRRLAVLKPAERHTSLRLVRDGRSARCLRHVRTGSAPGVELAEPRSEQFPEFGPGLVGVGNHLNAAHRNETPHLVRASHERRLHPIEDAATDFDVRTAVRNQPPNDISHDQMRKHLPVVVLQVFFEHGDEFAVSIDESADCRDCMSIHVDRLRHLARTPASLWFPVHMAGTSGPRTAPDAGG